MNKANRKKLDECVRGILKAADAMLGLMGEKSLLSDPWGKSVCRTREQDEKDWHALAEAAAWAERYVM